MITTVTLNPCNDKTLTLPFFQYGGLNRVRAQRLDIGGKGFNVARCLARLGESATATGFLFRQNGLLSQQALQADGVHCDCVWCDGSVRTNIKLFDQSTATITEINERGTVVDENATEALIKKIEALAAQSSLLVLSGSLPPGMSKHIYASIMQRCQAHCPVILDAEGEPLLRGIQQKPLLIKPNRYEMELLVGIPLPSLEFIKDAARSVVRAGVKYVAVSLGAEGALLVDEKHSYYAPPVRQLKVHSTVGAGDAMVAGFCAGILRQLPLDEILRRGVAAASSAIMAEGTAPASLGGAEALLPRIEIKTLP